MSVHKLRGAIKKWVAPTVTSECRRLSALEAIAPLAAAVRLKTDARDAIAQVVHEIGEIAYAIGALDGFDTAFADRRRKYITGSYTDEGADLCVIHVADFICELTQYMGSSIEDRECCVADALAALMDVCDSLGLDIDSCCADLCA